MSGPSAKMVHMNVSGVKRGKTVLKLGWVGSGAGLDSVKTLTEIYKVPSQPKQQKDRRRNVNVWF